MASHRQHKYFKTVGYMSTSDWLAAAGIGVSAGTLVTVSFGAVWLQHYLENLRLKREVIRRGIGSINGIIHDCDIFRDSHSISDLGITAINEVRAAFDEDAVLDAWNKWHDTNDAYDFVELVHAMSVACKLKQYQKMELRDMANAVGCACIP